MTASYIGSAATAAGTSGAATRSLALPGSIPAGSRIVISSGQSTGSATASLSGLTSAPDVVLGPEYVGVKEGMYVWEGEVGPADQNATLTVTWTATGKGITLAYSIVAGVDNPLVGTAVKVNGAGSGNTGTVTDQGSFAVLIGVARAASEASGPVITFSSPWNDDVHAESAIAAVGVQGACRHGVATADTAGATISTTPTAELYISAAVSYREAAGGPTTSLAPGDIAGSDDSHVLDQGAGAQDTAGVTDSHARVLGRQAIPSDTAGATDSWAVALGRRLALSDTAGVTDSAVIARTGMTTQAHSDPAGTSDSARLTRFHAFSDGGGSTDILDLDHATHTVAAPKGDLADPEPPAKWRYLVARLDGAGGQTWLDVDLPLLGDPSITTALTGAGSLTATVAAHLVDKLAPDGRPVLEPWSSAVFAEAGGTIRGGGLLTEVTWDRKGNTASITCIGISGYMFDMTYTDSQYWVQVDPLDVFRHAWVHMQSKVRGNLGVTVDATTSPVRIGTELEEVDFTTGAGEHVTFEAGPYKLAWWKTDDIGAEMTKLAEVTPFDWREVVTWSADHHTLEFRIELGYPRLGGRRHDLRFVVGENITAQPAEANLGEDYADEVTVVGAGDGKDAQHGWAARQDERRLRRAVTLVDRTLESMRASNASAAAELALRLGVPDISQVTVTDSRNAPLGSWQDGDDILVQLDTWADWFRITATTFTPNADTATLALRRVSGVR